MNRKTSKSQTNLFGIAACAFAVTPTGEVQLFPAGEFRASDGRPFDVPAWSIDADAAASIISDFESRQNRTVIDYEHQTLLTSQNGQPAPAGGWFGTLEWRESGLYAVDVEWTERASSMIASGEYRYISPVFTYDKKTGAVKKLLHAALTNNPALDGMDAVAAAAGLEFAYLIDQSDKEKLSMEELLNQLRWMLNLPVTATQDEVVNELQKAIDQIKAADAAATAAAGFSVAALIKTQADKITALTAAVNNPDPSRFVPIATMKALQDEVVALRAEKIKYEVDDLVEVALSDGRLLPAQEEWARNVGMKDIESLKEYIGTAQPVAALKSTQTGGNPPDSNDVVDLQNPDAIARAALTYQAEQAKAGITITTPQAVRHISKQGA